MRTLRVIAFLFTLASLCYGQATLTSTTASAAIGAGDEFIYVASATGFTAGSIAYVDREAMAIVSVSGLVIRVVRGVSGQTSAHANASTIYVGTPDYFKNQNPIGSCTAANEPVLPVIAIPSGDLFNCISGIWTVQARGPATFRFTDGVFFVSPSSCQSSVSGNAAGTNGYTTAGASLVPVVQASTSATGTNTHTFICTINVPSRLTTGKGIQITDVQFLYGVQTTGLGTQVATLASGTMNSSIVFSKIAYPVSAASETASTVTPVRADSGTLAITPVVASANVATTTAGGFYSVKFTPAAAIAVTTDLQQLLLTVTLQCAATSATITNSPGFLVHYVSVPL